MSDDFSLEGKVALVTGGGRGLGRGIALALAEAGADVVVASRTLGELEAVAEEIEAKGRRALVVTGDVSVPQDARRMVEEAAGWQARLDVLVNAAGVNKRIPSLEVTEDEWDWILGVNLKGTFFVSQTAGEVMVHQGRGSIINIASLLSAVGIPTLAPYAASKTGVVGLTRVLAAEWGPHGVRVNAIAPGYFRTKMTQRLFSDPDWVTRLKRQVPLGREGLPEDLGGTAVFLASDASRYLTGQVIYVDGGYLATREA
ncbi:MAG: Short-chain dehydrogenase/reductase SDR [Acetothermia bacterium 64_32]|nr:MAG: Short-chain dehydrogenase/reductase SDR [Acetothermia bacterium 64_32]HAF70555.1 2-deoxy-D-gluconate 3-dehydrogenase [Candidatus Acetothermia bacterium]